MAHAPPGVVKNFAKEVFQSTLEGAPPLNLESLKSRIQVAALYPEDLHILLFTAIDVVHVELVKFLIEEQHVDPNRLHTMHFEMKDGNVTVRSDLIPTPVLYIILTSKYPASKERLTEMFLYLVEKVNPETIKFRMVTGNPANNRGTILHYLATNWAFGKFDTVSIVRRICEKVPDLLEMKSDAGQTALHGAANGNVEMVKELLRLGADVTVRDNAGKTPRDIITSPGPIGREIRALLDSALEPVAPPGSPPRGPAAAGAGAGAPGPASPASPPYIGSPSDPQAGGRRRTRRTRSKRRSRRHYKVKY
jgi:hypothetical protein